MQTAPFLGSNSGPQHPAFMPMHPATSVNGQASQLGGTSHWNPAGLASSSNSAYALPQYMDAHSASIPFQPQVAPTLQTIEQPPQPQPPPAQIFQAVYSNVQVFELNVRDVGVMRRKTDNWMNATQILKVAGIDKAKRTRILEKDIMTMEPFEKVQGGYGRYQGTWIPINRAKQLAQDYNVAWLLQPLFDLNSDVPSSDPPQPLSASSTASKPDTHPSSSSSTTLQQQQQQSPSMGPPQVPSSLPMSTKKRGAPNNSLDENAMPSKRLRVDTTAAAAINGHGSGATPVNGSLSVPSSSTPTPKQNGPRSLNDALPPTSNMDTESTDRTRAEQHRQILMSLFMDSSPMALSPAAINLAQMLPPDLDADAPIDDQLHTALHWAAALAKTALAASLIEYGAQVRRGNHVGETALTRAVLGTNAHDNDAFGQLLDLLAPSLHTIDTLGRTVLHHIALVAGVKGRGASAKYYMESVLEFVAKRQDGDFENLVEAQDRNGDSALHIAARVGSKALVTVLLEVGAAKDRPNKLGLRPTDFGVGNGETAVNGTSATPSSPNSTTQISTQSADAARKITETLADINKTYTEELSTKNEALDNMRSQLHSATKELAEGRKEIELVRAQIQELERRKQRVAQLETAFVEEERVDWTGRLEPTGQPSQEPAFLFSDTSCLTQPNAPPDGLDPLAEPPLPSTQAQSANEALAQSRQMVQWYRRAMFLLKARLSKPKGPATELERRYQRIVSLCCGVPQDQVDLMLPQLLVALESDGAQIDTSRVAQFMKIQ